MEEFGGGGHQNVAGAQVAGDLTEIRQQAIDLSLKYMEENDNDESDITAGR